MNLSNCRQCGRTLHIGPNATCKKFCSSQCYRSWWREQSFTGATQEERIRRQLGEAPSFELSDVQASWLAATIDGEGSVGIHRQYSNDRAGFKYKAVVSVNNTDMAFLEQVKKLVEGFVHVKKNPTQPHHKKCWAVQIKHRATAPLLEQVKPYLIIKRKQADLVLEFCRAVAASPVHNRAMQPDFERLYLECKALNKRGKK